MTEDEHMQLKEVINFEGKPVAKQHGTLAQKKKKKSNFRVDEMGQQNRTVF